MSKDDQWHDLRQPDEREDPHGTTTPSAGFIPCDLSAELARLTSALAEVTANRDLLFKQGCENDRELVEQGSKLDAALRECEAWRLRAKQYEDAHKLFDTDLLALLQRCQNGEATCVFTAQVIESALTAQRKANAALKGALETCEPFEESDETKALVSGRQWAEHASVWLYKGQALYFCSDSPKYQAALTQTDAYLDKKELVDKDELEKMKLKIAAYDEHVRQVLAATTLPATTSPLVVHDAARRTGEGKPLQPVPVIAPPRK